LHRGDVVGVVRDVAPRARGGDADGPARRATSVCDPTPRLRVCLQLLEESTFETADRTTFTRS
jgi:hypothetical protein